jgi:hypothetical protein
MILPLAWQNFQGIRPVMAYILAPHNLRLYVTEGDFKFIRFIS